MTRPIYSTDDPVRLLGTLSAAVALWRAETARAERVLLDRYGGYWTRAAKSSGADYAAYVNALHNRNVAEETHLRALRRYGP